ncbi:solute carrier family 12 member 6-like [Paramacrobiotus metropolitanus]|uniref:solute carrier family 12 member 6-like n=1 Tax=Paramacrobiotus metropolitanus TaxID=2943436 RepID=UPI002446237D|nr:solute carrier family 12 member 6-like [Paramacrobiotus metropolitanus]
MGDRFRVTKVDDGAGKTSEFIPHVRTTSPPPPPQETDSKRNSQQESGDGFPVRHGVAPEVTGSHLPENGVFLRKNNNALRHQASSLSEGDGERPYTINFDQTKREQLFLFQEDLDEGLKVGAFLHQQTCGPKPSAQPANTGSKTLISKPAPKMGTLMGVFLPCIQNIFGVLMFIRLPFIIGTAGALESLLIVLLASATGSLN